MAAKGPPEATDRLREPAPDKQDWPEQIVGWTQAIGKLKEEGLSILLVEQNAFLALKLVDFVHVMSKGQVVYSARPEELSAEEFAPKGLSEDAKRDLFTLVPAGTGIPQVGNELTTK